MNCDRIVDNLALGTPLSGTAEEHLHTCVGCRTMIQALYPEPVFPAHQRLDSIRSLVTRSLQPVRPWPSDGGLISIALGSFIAFSLLVATQVDYRGLHHLSSFQRLIYYTAIAVCAAFLSVSLAQEIIPGSRRRVRPAAIVAFSVALLATVALLLFPQHDLLRFAKLGVPCLRLGVLCALASGFLGYLLLRKGFAASPVRLTTVAGFFAGLAGVAVLSLHCPVQNFAHVIVWHLGAMLIAGGGGALLGWWRVRMHSAAR